MAHNVGIVPIVARAALPRLEACTPGKLRERLRVTGKQSEILARVLLAMRDKEIAASVGISEPTVRTHLKALHARFGTCDRLELALRVQLAMHGAEAGGAASATVGEDEMNGEARR